MQNLTNQIADLKLDLAEMLLNAKPAGQDTKSIKVAYRALRKAAKVSQQIEALEAQLAEAQQEVNHLQALGLTEMETAVMEAFLPTLFEGELEFSETTDMDLANATGIEPKRIRGVLSSLVKKGIIYCDTSAIKEINYERKMNKQKALKDTSFVHLQEDFFYLHPSHC